MKVAATLRVLGFTVLSTLLSGCAEIGPLASSLTGVAPSSSVDIHDQTSIRLQDGNFVTLRTNVVGSSQGFNLLGFITIYPATVHKAMNQLYAHAEAEEGRPETLAHLMVEHSAIYVVLFSIPKVTARADLIEFVPAGGDEDGEDSSRTFGIRPVAHQLHHHSTTR